MAVPQILTPLGDVLFNEGPSSQPLTLVALWNRPSWPWNVAVANKDEKREWQTKQRLFIFHNSSRSELHAIRWRSSTHVGSISRSAFHFCTKFFNRDYLIHLGHEQHNLPSLNSSQFLAFSSAASDSASSFSTSLFLPTFYFLIFVMFPVWIFGPLLQTVAVSVIKIFRDESYRKNLLIMLLVNTIKVELVAD